MDNNNLKGDNSASKFKVIGFNCNSIGKNPKRSKVLHFLRKKNPDLLIVVDTRIASNIQNTVKEEWGGQVLFSSFDSQSRGVALFIKKNLPIKILVKFNDSEGNLLCVLIEFENKRLLLKEFMAQIWTIQTFMSPKSFKNWKIGTPATQSLLETGTWL